MCLGFPQEMSLHLSSVLALTLFAFLKQSFTAVIFPTDVAFLRVTSYYLLIIPSFAYCPLKRTPKFLLELGQRT